MSIDNKSKLKNFPVKAAEVNKVEQTFFKQLTTNKNISAKFETENKLISLLDLQKRLSNLLFQLQKLKSFQLEVIYKTGLGSAADCLKRKRI